MIYPQNVTSLKLMNEKNKACTNHPVPSLVSSLLASQNTTSPLMLLLQHEGRVRPPPIPYRAPRQPVVLTIPCTSPAACTKRSNKDSVAQFVSNNRPRKSQIHDERQEKTSTIGSSKREYKVNHGVTLLSTNLGRVQKMHLAT
jgi:hypothetical protein